LSDFKLSGCPLQDKLGVQINWGVQAMQDDCIGECEFGAGELYRINEQVSFHLVPSLYVRWVGITRQRGYSPH
jgi:hypothetical protein